MVILLPARPVYEIERRDQKDPNCSTRYFFASLAEGWPRSGQIGVRPLRQRRWSDAPDHSDRSCRATTGLLVHGFYLDCTGLVRDMRTRWPWAGSGHGPLPVLLLMLSIVTGLVDAVSYLALGHVFVANMTGNVVLLGFALAGAPGLSVPASLAALAAFLLGALIGGRLTAGPGSNRGWQLRTAAACGAPLLLIAFVVAVLAGQPVSSGARYALLVPMGLAMGLQNATARHLAVPDLTTTVLTLTLTGIAADSRLAGGPGGRPARRLIAIAAIFLGALVGALFVVHVDLSIPLALAASLVAGTALLAHALSSENAEWAR
jgi:uncharacterized membrane protein YoaK (UPF0700 family)